MHEQLDLHGATFVGTHTKDEKPQPGQDLKFTPGNSFLYLPVLNQVAPPIMPSNWPAKHLANYYKQRKHTTPMIVQENAWVFHQTDIANLTTPTQYISVPGKQLEFYTNEIELNPDQQHRVDFNQPILSNLRCLI